MSFEAYNKLTWWRKIVAERVITEEGVFAKDNVPEDYSGSELTVQVVQRIILSEPGGNYMMFIMDDVSGVMNSDRVEGVGAQITDGDSITVVIASQNGVTEDWQIISNDTLDQNVAYVTQYLYSFTGA